MFHWENCAENFNPQVLFVIGCNIDGSKYIPNTQYHCHDFMELSITTSGQIDYIIDDKFYALKRGQVLLFNPGIYHKEIVDSNTKSSQLHIGISNVKFHDTKDNYIENTTESPILTLTKYDTEFLNICEEIVKEQKSCKLGYPLVLKSLIMKLLILIHREIDEETSYYDSCNCSFECREKQCIVKEIIEYMKGNYMNDISLDKISKNMYLSPVYISKIFKEETGDSPINYLIKIRLSKSKELLKEKNLSIKAVAQSVGYNDAYYFSKLFKKYYGVPPSKITET